MITSTKPNIEQTENPNCAKPLLAEAHLFVMLFLLLVILFLLFNICVFHFNICVLLCLKSILLFVINNLLFYNKFLLQDKIKYTINKSKVR